LKRTSESRLKPPTAADRNNKTITMPLLELKDVHVSYGAIRAIRGVSLEVQEKRIVTLIGANGAGKSTLLRTISGLQVPLRGEILLDGRSIAGLRPHRIVRQGLVQVPEGRGIFANLTVAENLALGAYCRRDSRAIRAQRRDRALGFFPRIRERLAQNAGTLSGGEQQMLAIARALVAGPRLLLLDEPSLGLAPQIMQTIFHVIREINELGTTILLVEQNAHMALSMAHHAYVLETGQIALQGPAAELAKSEDVRRAYLGVSH
jgi:branched-chain amino acid transport system ATP-binding protein